MNPGFPPAPWGPRAGLRTAALAIWAVLLLAPTGCAHQPNLVARGLTDATTTEHELKELLRPRRTALLIGVDTYLDPTFPDLRFSASDAATMAEVLSSPTGGGFEEVTVLVRPEDTTRVRILRELRLLSRRLGPEDILVIYFSGHGTLAPVGTGESELFLLPSDANSSDLSTTALSLSSVRSFIGDLPAERKAMIVDACFNGDGKSVANPTLSTEAAASVGTRPQVRAGDLGVGESYLFASSLGRPAFEDDELKQGVYTHYLLQSMTWARQQSDLDGDGVLTAWEAHDYARNRTRDHSGGAQVPEAAIRVVGSNDLILVGDASKRAERDRALIFSYQNPASLDGAVLVVNGRSKGVFPGTMPVTPGRQHVEVRSRNGEWLAGGYMDIKTGESISYADIALRTRAQKGFAAARLLVGGGPTAIWSPLWGDGFTQIELSYGLRRSKGPARGLYFSGALSGGLSPSRDGYVNNHRIPRPTFGAALELGWSYNRKRLRLRLGGNARVTFLPILHNQPMGTFPLEAQEAGWIIGSIGPAAHVGVALNPHLAVMLGTSLQLSFLDLGNSDNVTAQVHALLSLGIEHSF